MTGLRWRKRKEPAPQSSVMEVKTRLRKEKESSMLRLRREAFLTGWWDSMKQSLEVKKNLTYSNNYKVVVTSGRLIWAELGEDTRAGICRGSWGWDFMPRFSPSLCLGRRNALFLWKGVLTFCAENRSVADESAGERNWFLFYKGNEAGMDYL